MESKLCKDCRHFDAGRESCRHQNNMRRDLVHGKYRSIHSPDFLREAGNRCTPEALWFEPKDGA